MSSDLEKSFNKLISILHNKGLLNVSEKKQVEDLLNPGPSKLPFTELHPLAVLPPRQLSPETLAVLERLKAEKAEELKGGKAKKTKTKKSKKSKKSLKK